MLRGLGSFLLSTTTSGLMALGRLTYLLPADNLGSRSFLSRLLASLRARWGLPVTIAHKASTWARPVAFMWNRVWDLGPFLGFHLPLVSLSVTMAVLMQWLQDSATVWIYTARIHTTKIGINGVDLNAEQGFWSETSQIWLSQKSSANRKELSPCLTTICVRCSKVRRRV